jgi:hypothetical protein
VYNEWDRSRSIKGLIAGMVLIIDFRKAFDTVDHQILSSKLQSMGVFNIKWFQSYFTERKHFVNVDSSKSYLADVSCGYQ